MIYFDAPFVTISVVSDGNIIWAEWKGTPSGEPLRNAFELGTKAIVENHATRWLADTRHLGTMDPLDVKWVNDNWIPQAVAAGIRWMAFVMPQRVVMQIQVKSFMARIDDRELANAYFGNIDEAWAWLRAQQ